MERWLGVFIVVAFFNIGILAQWEERYFTWDDVNPMDEYVHRDDGWFSWRILTEIRYENLSVTLYTVNMTSQKWIDEEYSSSPVWFHMMAIAIPDEIQYPDAGLMAIAGGGNNNARPEEKDGRSNVLSAVAAAESKTVTGYIKNIPNQPIVFKDDPDQLEKKEDRIIAWTWKTYLEMPVKNPEVVLRMPMTKGAKRALDTMAELVKFKVGLNINRFGVTGASKRGWTTWSVGATDRRVVMIWPMVLSLLDINNSGQDHFRALDGQWSWAVKDYWDAGIMKNTRNPYLQEVFDYEDMIRYAPRLTMPKVMLASVGDEFFSLTDSHPWWPKMSNPKYILMFANAEHTMAPHYLKLAKTLMGTWHAFMRQEEMPEVTWERSETGSDPNRVGHIDVYYKEGFEPNNVIGFYSTTGSNNKTEGRRDFRMLIASNRPCGSGTSNGNCEQEPHLYLWRRDGNVTRHSATHYSFSMPQPAPDSENIWTGFFVESQFDGPESYQIHFTTEVQMVPDRFPSPPCVEDPYCHTNLV